MINTTPDVRWVKYLFAICALMLFGAIAVNLHIRHDAIAAETYPHNEWTHQVSDLVMIYAVQVDAHHVCYVAVGDGPWSTMTIGYKTSSTVAMHCLRQP